MALIHQPGIEGSRLLYPHDAGGRHRGATPGRRGWDLTRSIMLMADGICMALTLDPGSWSAVPHQKSDISASHMRLRWRAPKGGAPVTPNPVHPTHRYTHLPQCAKAGGNVASYRGSSESQLIAPHVPARHPEAYLMGARSPIVEVEVLASSVDIDKTKALPS